MFMTRLEETHAPASGLTSIAEGEAAHHPLRGMKLYHGTTSSRARKILKEGLRPRGEGKGNYSPQLASHHGCVYLSTVYGPAYACRAIPRLGPLAVVEIDAGGLHADRLRPDEDYMLQCVLPPNMAVGAERGVAVLREMRERMDEHRDFWRNSLDSLGTVAYQGTIPPEAITRVAFFDPRKNAEMAYVMMDASLTVLAHMIFGSQFASWNRWMFDGPQAVSPNDLDPWLRAVEAQDGLRIPEGIEEIVRQRRSELQAVLERWNVRVEANPAYGAGYRGLEPLGASLPRPDATAPSSHSLPPPT